MKIECSGELGKLTRLDLGNKSLEGAMPADLFNCTQLIYLNLSNTYMDWTTHSPGSRGLYRPLLAVSQPSRI